MGNDVYVYTLNFTLKIHDVVGKPHDARVYV